MVNLILKIDGKHLRGIIVTLTLFAFIAPWTNVRAATFLWSALPELDDGSPETPTQGVQAVSQAAPAPAAPAPLDRRLQIHGDLNADYFVTAKSLRSGHDYLRLKSFQFYFSQNISENVRAQIVTKLDQDFRSNGRWDVTHTQLKDLVKEAYIEIKNIGGKPVAVILGMSEVAWGLDHHGMPIFNNSLMHEQLADADQDQVVGLTVTLDQKNILGFYDKAEASFFETDGSLNIGSFDGFSIRLSKQINDRLSLENSFISKGNHGLGISSESRASVGVIFESGKYTVWSEGVLFRGNQLYPHSHFALTAGITRKLRRGRITVESTWVTRSLSELGVGYFYDINKNTTFGPEIRLRSYDRSFADDGKVAIFGFRLNQRF